MKAGGDTTPPRVGSPSHADAPRTGEVLIGSSPAFRRVVSVVDAVAANDSVVLVEGESGTGKEILAKRIHRRSRRSQGPFIPVNCASISDSLFESQFFGHIRGAFTGAITETLGVVRVAEGGTLLLDEISEIPMHLQSKLLRLLQEREVVPVGGARPISVDVRFVAATNKSLWREVLKGDFRADLYHRLNVVRIEVPPLRERRDDILPLLDWYLDHYAREYAMARRHLGEGIRRQLVEYVWPGNVRELCSYIERLYAADLPPLPPSLLTWDDGAGPIPAAVEAAPGRIAEIADLPPTCTLAQVEQTAIRKALRYTGWNRSAAARMLAVHRSTLLRKMRRYGLGG